jgi:hypothetical protein
MAALLLFRITQNSLEGFKICVDIGYNRVLHLRLPSISRNPARLTSAPANPLDLNRFSILFAMLTLRALFNGYSVALGDMNYASEEPRRY